MPKSNIIQTITRKVENYIPMTLTSLLLFSFIIYFLFNVGKTIFDNYHSNLEITKEEEKVIALEDEIEFLKNQINYYGTKSFKEKEAREKLGYKAPGEKVISLPLDRPEDKIADSALGEVQIKTPNYRLWWAYFTQ